MAAKMTAEDKRRNAHQHYDAGDGRNHPAEVTCGQCGRSWCERCDPAPSAMCHWCNGYGHSEAPIRARRSYAHQQ